MFWGDMEHQGLASSQLEIFATSNPGESEHFLRKEDGLGQQQTPRHKSHQGPGVSTEAYGLEQWKSTVKKTKINETEMLLEATQQGEDQDNVQIYEGGDTRNEKNKTASQKYDTDDSTRLECVIGVFIGGLLALACIASGIYVLATRKEKLSVHIGIDPAAREALSLVFNVILTFCLDSMAFVHSVSLRWALYNEHRLEFNTNLRLFTSSTKSGPNRWYMNIFSMLCLILCYGASSYLLLPDMTERVYINGVAVLVLGLALLGHTSVSTWCLRTRSAVVLTWSSNPLSNCLAAVQNGMIERRPGRCMRSVHDQKPFRSSQFDGDDDIRPAHSVEKQENMYKLHRLIRMIIGLLWTLAVLAVVWMLVILGLNLTYAADDGNSCLGRGTPLEWNSVLPGSCDGNMATLYMSPSANSHNKKYPFFSYGLQVFLGLLFISAVQAAQSVALHCAELLVNISRDENVWRDAYNGGETKKGPKGSLLTSDSLMSALLSWENLTLTLFKSLLHWSVGQAVQPSITAGIEGDIGDTDQSLTKEQMAALGIRFDMIYTRLILYAILAILLASFATVLALRKRSGPQPATMGHLQTIADLVDDWTTSEKGRIWWGDKGANEGTTIRHAGTSWNPKALGQISTNALYAG